MSEALMETTETPGYCTLCRSRCGTLNTVRNGRLISVRPDPTHPTGSAMCMKGRAAPELVHSPHRLRYPMRRTRPKGAADPGWQRISWEEALSEIAARLSTIRAESGAEAVVFGVTTPSGTPLSDSIDWIERFVRHFGSPNICYATEICNWHKDFAHAFTFGSGMPTPDVEQADLIMLWGYNPASTWLAMANAVGRGRSEKAQLLVVDPRPTALTRSAEHWLPVRPGTDAALALGWIRALILAEQVDFPFLRQWTNASFLVRSDTGHFLRERDLDPHATANRYMVWDFQAQAARPAISKHRVDDATSADADAADIEAAVATAEILRADGALTEHAALRGRFDVTVSAANDATAAQVGKTTIQCSTAFELLISACDGYTPEHVASVTGIPVAKIVAAAQTIGAAVSQKKRIAYHAWSGVAQHTNATQTERAIAVLYALTGSFDAVGGNRQYPTQPVNPISVLTDLPPAQRAKALGFQERPLGPPARGWVTARDTYRAILDHQPYPVRAFFGFGSNPLSSQGDTAMAHAAFAALEYHVHCDLFETPTGRFADILLPVGTPWEREGLRVGFELNAQSQQRVQLRRQLVAPQGEARSDNDILFDLACRLEMGDAFFNGSLEAGWNHMLAPLRVSVAQLRAHPEGIDVTLPERSRHFEKVGFATETGRVELYSELLHRHQQAPLPSFVAPDESRRAGARFPLVLSSAKNGYFCHSQHRSLASLRKRAPAPLVEMSAAVATVRSICDGDPVVISTRNGQARFTAKVSVDVAPDTVVAEFGWWQACPEIGAPGYMLIGEDNRHFNGLISSEAADPISGSVAHRSFRCDIVRDPAFDPARRTWPDWRDFVVADIVPLAEGVMEIRFEACNGGTLPDFQPGQHLTLRIGGLGPESRASGAGTSATAAEAAVMDIRALPSHIAERTTRAYSLTGPARLPGRRHYTIAVRHQRGVAKDGTAWEGRLSSRLHRHLMVGAQVELRAPAGRFTLPTESPQPIVLIAGGIGITPFISQLETIAASTHLASAPKITLHYANRHHETHAFRARLIALQTQLPKLMVINYYNDVPTQVMPKVAPGYLTTRISDAVISDAEIAARARVYMCGPDAMMRAVRSGLVARGMPNFDIFHEAFGSPALSATEAGAANKDNALIHSVTFRRSGLVAQWRTSDPNLLAFAEQCGVVMPSGCRVGQCESCAVRVIKGQGMHVNGEPSDDPDVLLSCQAIPLSDIELDA